MLIEQELSKEKEHISEQAKVRRVRTRKGAINS